MKRKSLISALAIALLCVLALSPLHSQAASPSTTGSKLLKNIKVTGDLANGGSFKGMLNINNLSYDQAKGLLMSGSVKGQAISKDGSSTAVNEKFQNIPATLNESGGDMMSSAALAQPECDLLNLDLGPIFLDLLGLQLDLSEINLDLTAVPGAGNLLGNLLCAVAGLLDGDGLLGGGLDGVLGLLESLLSELNSLLG
ncbi:hypothetical protein [Fictibacillus fluitans]|uniref:ABC transporter substrate-binding protein n=1 Tax=Fictibacillus fluitans TaxID=3058422 RepID=A0ABT8I3P3_9BACL|nr:hypothetical protein [Fictibacillus sp. NE201]MDN4527649.1 hypothetical protein [Fictibacillus sp. NE201]